MKVEIEARYYDIDVDVVRRALRGRVWTPLKKYKRMVWDIKDKPGAFLRVRECAMSTEITVKHIRDPKKIRGTLEKTIIFEGRRLLEPLACIFRLLGYPKGSLQETKRAEWIIFCPEGNRILISLDYWPGLKPLLEIEAADEEGIQYTEKLLKLPSRFEGGIAELYSMEYGITKEELNAIPRLTEGALARRKQNK